MRPGSTAGSDRAEILDFFVAVPGLGRPRQSPELEELAVPFGEELVHYFVGAATCAVPGVPAGLEELWRRAGVLPWERLVEPAIRLARSGVAMPLAHAKCLAMLAPVMTMREGGRIYAPGGRLLEEGDRMEQPGLVAALEVVSAEGLRTFYEGTMAEALLGLMEERAGLVTPDDLARVRDRMARAGGGAVRRRPGPDARRALTARRRAGGPSPAPRGPSGRPSARLRPRARRPALQRPHVRAHDEPRGRRP